MDLKCLLKVSLCAIQLVFTYRVLKHDDCYLLPIQLFIAGVVAAL